MNWWQGVSIYQVYPRSYQDSDGDGIGDLAGIIERLDYIADLGVDVVWVSPFFASPQQDFGYDITDYLSVAPEYGQLEQAEQLIDQAHERGLKVMFDLVLNHTSDQHPWFLRSRGSRSNPKSDWYIWADGRGRGRRKPPNNWKSAMEVKSAWQYSQDRGQWYLATFLPFQPDLNWRNPAVREAMLNAVRFWLDRGVDGFRLDIFGQIMKDPKFRNNPMQLSMNSGIPRVWDRKYNENTDDNFQLAKDLQAVCGEYDNPKRILLGEVFGSPSVLRKYLGDQDESGLDLVFLFDFLTYRYDPEWFSETIAKFEASFPAPMVPTYVLENHDRSRSIDRVDGDIAKAKVLATILLTLRGVPTIYMGQEIGMSNTHMPVRDALDPVAATFFSWIPEPIFQRLPERLNRDEMRTPMQWQATKNAGFCPPDVRPWLRVNPNHVSVNVTTQDQDQDSILNLYRRLLQLRKDHDILRTGQLELFENLPPKIFGFRRSSAEQSPTAVPMGATDCLEVYANLSDEPHIVPNVAGVILAQSGTARRAGTSLHLWPNTAVVLGTDVHQRDSAAAAMSS
jgi:alpha-glucosidase